MKKLLSFTALFSLLLLISCSKDPAKEEAKEDSCNRIVEVLGYHPYEAVKYQTAELITYDESGRIKMINYGAFDKAEYTYYKDSIVVKATNIWSEDISDTYYLDNSGRVLRTKRYDYNFKYNADGYLIWYQEPSIYNGEVMAYYPFSLKWENGNLVEVLNLTANNKIALYYYNEPNQDLLGYNSPLYIGGVIGLRNMFYLIKGGFFGKQSKNLLRHTIRPNSTIGIDIKYAYDAKGRISGSEEGYRFNYQCP
jgi:hypothetical protein